jgi:hypothetical protein
MENNAASTTTNASDNNNLKSSENFSSSSSETTNKSIRSIQEAKQDTESSVSSNGKLQRQTFDTRFFYIMRVRLQIFLFSPILRCLIKKGVCIIN